MCVPDSKPTLQEGRERCQAAIDALLEYRHYIGELDESEGWRAIALSGVIKSWDSVDKDDQLWYAVRELVNLDYHFDDDLGRAVVDLLAAADRAGAECDEGAAPLSLRTFEQLHEAHNQIWAALEKVRERQTARCVR
jgi:hypothetical protein